MLTTPTPRQNSLFWILNIAGWVLLWLIYIFLYRLNRQVNQTVVLGLAITYFTGFCTSILLRAFYHHLHYQKRAILTLSLMVLAAAFISSNIWLILDLAGSYPLVGAAGLNRWFRFKFYFDNIYSHLWVMTLWSALYFIIKFWQAFIQAQARTEKANALAQAAQLQMLRYQLNPHFLFNALNSIRALIDEDTKNAKRVITELSEFLRYSLISKTYADVPLSHELEAIGHYFAIEKIRYEDKLEVKFEIDPLAEDYPVLSFLIHPLIENAIKYGMQTSPLPLKIRVQAMVNNGNLQVEVSNTGKWIEPLEAKASHQNGTGTGLENVRRRLENAFPNRHRFEIAEENGAVHILLEIRKAG